MAVATAEGAVRSTRSRSSFNTHSLTIPNTRSLVGALLIVLATLGLYISYISATHMPQQDYVVASHDIAVGQQLSASDLTLAPMHLDRTLAEHHVFTSISKVVNAYTTAPFLSGELIQTGGLVSNPGSNNEVAVNLDPSQSVGSTLHAGEFVDVYSTLGSGPAANTTRIGQHIQILSVVSNQSSLSTDSTQTILLAISDTSDATAVINASVAGKLTLVRTIGSS